MSRNQSHLNLKNTEIINTTMSEAVRYPSPANLNVLWSFGFLLLIYLLVQIITGIMLAIHYVPTTEGAFGSVTHIMYEVHNGSIIRYMHSNGASMFLLCVYIHISKAIYYFSYLPPRVAVWITGVILFLLICATAFTGYVLPWGQMSLWGATVIINFFTAIPIYGAAITKWIVGGHAIGTATLQRFFIFHVVTPFIILILSCVHIYLLHKVGSSNPTIFGEAEPIPFYPYFFLKDLQVLSVSLIIYAFFVCYAPDVLGHPDNYIKANAVVTPKHIVPEWYFLPFYAILRSIPSKMGGVLAMLFSILVWFIIPFYKTSREKMMKSLPVYHIFVWFFFFDFIALGWIGVQPVEEPFIMLGQAFTIYYFLFFLIIIPFYPFIDTHFFAPLLAFLRKLLLKEQLTDGYHVLTKDNAEYHYLFYNYFFIKGVSRNIKETLNKFFRFLKLSRCEKFVTLFFDTFIGLCFKYARYAVKRAARARRIPKSKLNFKISKNLPYKPIQTYGGFSKMTSFERAKARPPVNRRVPFESKKQSNILPFFISITVMQEYISYDYLLIPEIIVFIAAFFLLLWSYIHPRSFWSVSFFKLNNGILIAIILYLFIFLSRLYINIPLMVFKKHLTELDVYIETVYFMNSMLQNSFMAGFFEGSVQIFLYFISFIFLIIIVQSPQGQHYYSNSPQKFSTFYFLFSLSTIGLSLLLVAKHLVVIFLLIELISLSLILLMAQAIYRSVQMSSVFFYFFVSFLGTVFFLFFCLTYFALFETYLLTEINLNNLFNVLLQTNKLSVKNFLSIVCILSLFFFFSIKLGLFPFSFWVRNVYSNLPFIFLAYIIPVVKSIYWFFFTKCFITVFPLLYHFQPSSLSILSILLIFSFVFSIFFLIRETLIKGVFAYLSIISNIFFLSIFCNITYSSFFLLNASWFFNIIYSLFNFYLLYFFTTISLVDTRVTKSQQIFGLSNNSPTIFLAPFNNHLIRVIELSYISDLSLMAKVSLQSKVIFSILLITVMALPPFPIFFAKLIIFIIVFSEKAYYMLFLLSLSSIFSVLYYILFAKISFFDKNKITFFNIQIVEHNKKFNLFYFLYSILFFSFYLGPLLFPFISIFLGMA